MKFISKQNQYTSFNAVIERELKTEN